MKYSVMSLILFVLADPVLAAQPGSPGECLQLYRQNLNDLDAGQLQSSELMNYADRCMPEPAHSDELHYYKRLQITDEDNKVFTVQT
jgi:hypothetical protein